jgi:hypothetical protein
MKKWSRFLFIVLCVIAGFGSVSISQAAVASASSSITSDINPSAVGQMVTFTITAYCSNYPSLGILVLTDGSTELTSKEISFDESTRTAITTYQTSSLSLGSHVITASFVEIVSDGNCSIPDASMTQVVTGGAPGTPVPTLFGGCPVAYPIYSSVIMTTAQSQFGYDAPGGLPVRRTDGSTITLPNDFARKGWDEYLIIAVKVFKGQTWYGLFIGSCQPVYVPADKVTLTRPLAN